MRIALVVLLLTASFGIGFLKGRPTYPVGSSYLAYNAFILGCLESQKHTQQKDPNFCVDKGNDFFAEIKVILDE